MVICLDVVPNHKVIMEDLFDTLMLVDRMGSRNILIICMLVNARTMNIETGLETFFSSLKSGSFSVGQSWKTLVHRGFIKLHAAGRVSQM